MSKRSKGKARRVRQSKAARQQQHQAQLVRWVGVGLVVAVVVAGLFTLRNTAGASVAQARLDLDPVYGNPDAEVSIIEYASYGCRACRQLHTSGILEDIVAEYDGRVNLIFRDFPYISPSYDQATANVAQCVLDQSNTAYWDLHHLLYTDYYMNRTPEQLVTIAGTEIGGVDEAALRACAAANTHVRTVHYDGERGRSLGLTGSPSIFVGEQRIFSPDRAAIRAAIEAELAG